jgi:hypothetical protein
MSNPSRVPCFQCAYYKPTDTRQPGPSEVGMCRRRAPVAMLPLLIDNGYSPIVNVWPPVRADDSCGDFERSR